MRITGARRGAIRLDGVQPMNSRDRRTSAPPRALSGEAGFTLVELLVTMVTALIILAALLGLWVQAAGHERSNAARYDTLDRAATALERMTREVRDAVQAARPSPDVLVLQVWTFPPSGGAPSATREIRYECGHAGTVADTFACLRIDGAERTAVVDGLTRAAVFETPADTRAVRMRLDVSVKDAANPIVLRSSATLRNG